MPPWEPRPQSSWERMMIGIAQGHCRIAVVEKHVELHGWGDWHPQSRWLTLCLCLTWLLGLLVPLFLLRGQWSYALACSVVASQFSTARGNAIRRAIVQAALDDEEVFDRLQYQGMIEIIRRAPRSA